eukprot:8171930-Lingulodinium_polyedra.AAC.1
MIDLGSWTSVRSFCERVLNSMLSAVVCLRSPGFARFAPRCTKLALGVGGRCFDSMCLKRWNGLASGGGTGLPFQTHVQRPYRPPNRVAFAIRFEGYDSVMVVFA